MTLWSPRNELALGTKKSRLFLVLELEAGPAGASLKYSKKSTRLAARPRRTFERAARSRLALSANSRDGENGARNELETSFADCLMIHLPLWYHWLWLVPIGPSLKGGLGYTVARLVEEQWAAMKERLRKNAR
ncbi:hypothetical protein KM043_016397 [Ampulex compressa]|nr:hypothetical protein KM043_016397 [Ampulex compressa]